MTIVAYIHGYVSDGKETTNKIKTAFFAWVGVGLEQGVEVVRLDSQEQAQNIYKQLFKQIAPLIERDQVILVGTSLGGFWANYMAEKMNLPCILINPVPRPSTSLLKYLPEGGVASSYKVFEGPVKGIHRNTLIGLKDDVLDPFAVSAHYNLGHIVWFENEGHRFTDYGPVINIIMSTISQPHAKIQDVPPGTVHQPSS